MNCTNTKNGEIDHSSPWIERNEGREQKCPIFKLNKRRLAYLSFNQLVQQAKENFEGYLQVLSDSVYKKHTSAEKERTISLACTIAKYKRHKKKFIFPKASDEKYKNAFLALEEASIFPGSTPPTSVFSDSFPRLMDVATKNAQMYRKHVISRIVSDLPENEGLKKLEMLSFFSHHSNYYRKYIESGGLSFYYQALRVISYLNLCWEPTEDTLNAVDMERKKLERLKIEKKEQCPPVVLLPESDFLEKVNSNFFGCLRNISECLHNVKCGKRKILKTVGIMRALKKEKGNFVFKPKQRNFRKMILALYEASIIPGVVIINEEGMLDSEVSLFASKGLDLKKAAQLYPKQYIDHVSFCLFSELPEEKRPQGILKMVQLIHSIDQLEFSKRYSGNEFYYRIFWAIADLGDDFLKEYFATRPDNQSNRRSESPDDTPFEFFFETKKNTDFVRHDFVMNESDGMNEYGLENKHASWEGLLKDEEIEKNNQTTWENAEKSQNFPMESIEYPIKKETGTEEIFQENFDPLYFFPENELHIRQIIARSQETLAEVNTFLQNLSLYGVQ